MPLPQTPERGQRPDVAQRTVHTDPQNKQHAVAGHGRHARASMPASRHAQRQSSSPLPEVRLSDAPTTPSRVTSASATGPASRLLSSAIRGQDKSMLTSHSTPSRRAPSTPLRSAQKKMTDAEVVTRSRYVASLADEIVACYASLGKTVRDGTALDELDTVASKWEHLDKSKKSQLIDRVWGPDADIYLDAAHAKLTDIGAEQGKAKSALDDVVKSLNRAQFVHGVYQLPIGRDTTKEDRVEVMRKLADSDVLISSRGKTELVAAFHAYWQYIAPFTPERGATEDEIMLYLDIGRQIALIELAEEGDGQSLDSAEAAKTFGEITDRSIATKHLQDTHGVVGLEFLDQYDLLQGCCIDELLSFEGDLKSLRALYPFSSMADDLSQYALHLTKSDDTDEAPAFSSAAARLLADEAREDETEGDAEDIDQRDLPVDNVAAQPQARLANNQHSVPTVPTGEPVAVSASTAREDREASGFPTRDGTNWERAEVGKNADARRYPGGPVEQARDLSFDNAGDDNPLEEDEHEAEPTPRKRGRPSKNKGKGKQVQREESAVPQPTTALRRSKRNAPVAAPDEREEAQSSEENAEATDAEVQNENDESDDEVYTTNNAARGKTTKKRRRLQNTSTPSDQVDAVTEEGEEAAEGKEEEENDEIEDDEDYDDEQQSDSASARATPARSSKKAKGGLAKDRAKRRDREEDGAPVRVRKPKFVGDKKKYYVTNNNATGRQPWTTQELQCLMTSLNELYPEIRDGNTSMHYARILELHGPHGTHSHILAKRNPVQLKDKARNEILRLRRIGEEVPNWAGLLFRTIRV